MSIKKEDLFYFFIFLFFAFIFLTFGIYGYPLFGGDSYAFLPTSIHLSRGEGLINEIYTPSGQKEMLFYPPLFPYVQSLLMFGTKVNAIYLSLAITSISTLLIFTLLIRKEFQNIKFSYSKILLILLLFSGLSSGLDTSSGRPEILLNLLFAITLLVYVYKPVRANVYYGALVVLIMLCSIITGVYASLILLLYYVYSKQTVKSYFITLFSALICFAVFLVVYPYSIFDLIDTMHSEARKIVFIRDEAFTFAGFLKYHITSPVYSFYFLLFTCCAVIVVRKIYRSVFQALLLLILLCLIYYFGFRNLATNYYVYNLFVIYVFIVIKGFVNYPKLKYLLMVLFLFLSVGFVRRTLLFVYFYDEQASINATANQLEGLRIDNLDETTSFWPFMYYQNINTPVSDTSCLLYQQVYNNLNIEDYKNIKVQNTRFESLEFLGTTIANNPPFYYYILVENKK